MKTAIKALLIIGIVSAALGIVALSLVLLFVLPNGSGSGDIPFVGFFLVTLVLAEALYSVTLAKLSRVRCKGDVLIFGICMLFLYGFLPGLLILVSRDADYSGSGVSAYPGYYGSGAVGGSPDGAVGGSFSIDAQPTYYELPVDSFDSGRNADGAFDAFVFDLPTGEEPGNDSNSSEKQS